MFSFKNKKSRICFIGMLISLGILIIVFCATDGLLGDKEFSEYTCKDWSIAILPLSIIAVSCISALGFALIIIIPMIWQYPSLINYITKIKFSGIDVKTEFLVFDHNEFKRACCHAEPKNGLWISIKEYDLKSKSWITLEAGRRIENADDLVSILQEDYKYDSVKFYNANCERSEVLPWPNS